MRRLALDARVAAKPAATYGFDLSWRSRRITSARRAVDASSGTNFAALWLTSRASAARPSL